MHPYISIILLFLQQLKENGQNCKCTSLINVQNRSWSVVILNIKKTSKNTYNCQYNWRKPKLQKKLRASLPGCLKDKHCGGSNLQHTWRCENEHCNQGNFLSNNNNLHNTTFNLIVTTIKNKYLRLVQYLAEIF